MPTTSRHLVAAGLTVFAVAACGGDRGVPSPTGSPPAGAGGTASPVDPTGSGRPSANATASAQPRSSASARGSAPPTPRPTAVSGAAPATPLAVGRYVYDTSGTMTVSGQAHQMPPETTLTAAEPQGDKQLQTWDLRGSDGTGQVIKQTLAFDTGGVSLAELLTTTYPGGGVTDTRDLRPTATALLARTGAQPGDHQAFTMQGSGVTADFTVDVQRTETVVVGGTAVPTAVVQVVIHFSGAVTGQQTSTLWVTAAHAQVVKENVASDVSNGVLTVDFDYTATLRSLGPS